MQVEEIRETPSDAHFTRHKFTSNNCNQRSQSIFPSHNQRRNMTSINFNDETSTRTSNIHTYQTLDDRTWLAKTSGAAFEESYKHRARGGALHMLMNSISRFMVTSFHRCMLYRFNGTHENDHFPESLLESHV